MSLTTLPPRDLPSTTLLRANWRASTFPGRPLRWRGLVGQTQPQLAEELGLDAEALDSEEGAKIFAGNETPEGAAPLAQAYAGHQFGGFVPQLGDGRACSWAR